MKITELRALALGIPLRSMTPPSPWEGGLAKQVLVRLSTDEGLIGWGECFAYGAPLAVCNVVEDALAPLVVGQDPMHIEQLTRSMHQALMIWGRRGLGMFAISGVELALWDLVAKARQAPLYELLGGLVQPTVQPTRASCAIPARPMWGARLPPWLPAAIPPSSFTRSTWSQWVWRGRRAATASR